MTIDEAIKVLTIRSESPFVRANDETRKAMKLGIQALRRCKAAFENGTFIPVYPLEGQVLED